MIGTDPDSEVVLELPETLAVTTFEVVEMAAAVEAEALMTRLVPEIDMVGWPVAPLVVA